MAGASARRTLLLGLWLLAATGLQAAAADRTAASEAENKLHAIADGGQSVPDGRPQSGPDTAPPGLIAQAPVLEIGAGLRSQWRLPAARAVPRRTTQPPARAPPVSPLLA